MVYGVGQFQAFVANQEEKKKTKTKSEKRLKEDKKYPPRLQQKKDKNPKERE